MSFDLKFNTRSLADWNNEVDCTTILYFVHFKLLNSLKDRKLQHYTLFYRKIRGLS